MENIYSLIEDKPATEAPAQEQFDVEAWKEGKQKQRDEAYALGDETALKVNSDPSALNGYLEVMARFPERTASNCLLVFAQRPSATRIGPKDYWDNEHALIKRGERGFTIIEQGDAFTRDDGSLGSYFNTVRVFDEAQTTARKIHPRRYQEGNVVTALVKTAKPRIVAADDLQGELAVYDRDSETLHLQKGLDQSQIFWALASELAQSEFAHSDKNWSREAYFDRAELAAAVLAKRYGIGAPFGDAPAPAPRDAEPKDIRSALSDVQAAAKAISRQAALELDRPKEREQAHAR
ncbi:hypothetical protein [Gordonibacter sp.]|uniref:hypothetical protein n=1 Tax=Gordonibacter sp. TaxID=1968902 RepID=UPI002FCA98DB